MTERPTPLTDANAEALEAYRRKINEAARGPYGTTIRMPDPDAPQGIYELARTLERDRAELMEALREARVDIESWAGYASEYFREKHHLKRELDALDALLARLEGE